MSNFDSETLFRSLLLDHYGAVVKVARAYTRTAADGQDLAQDILLEVWRSLPQFQHRSSPATWMYRVALNTALGWRRKEGRRRARQQPMLEAVDASIAAADGSRQAVEREQVERLYDAIRQLPKADAALVLLYLDNLSYSQMAEVLGISEGNVGVKLTRARRALRALLKEPPHGS